MTKVFLISFLILFLSCKETEKTNYSFLKGLWVMDSTLAISPNKMYKEVYIYPTSSKRKIYALSEDRYYAYLKKSEYFTENDSTYFDYYLSSESNYYLIEDTLRIHNTTITTNGQKKLILSESNYSVNYLIQKLDSSFLQLKYNDVIHYYSIINRDVKIENKSELLKYLELQNK